MDIKDALVYWNDWWVGKSFDTGIIRDKYLSDISEFLSAREIIIVEGVRRSGKSTILHQMIQKILEHTDKNNVCYINVDDSRFGQDLEQIYESYLELSNPKGTVYFFIDEIQNIPLWEKWIKSKYDKDKKIKFIISGSTSSLLGTEYARLLSGRYFRISVMPLSFQELLSFSGISFSDEVSQIKNKTAIKRSLSEYLEFGGFPEVVLEKSGNIKKERLKAYFESILLKDVILKNDVRNSEKIKDMAYYFLSNVTSEYNYNRLAKILDISTLTAEAYFSFLRESFLIDSTSIYSYRVKEQIQHPRKIYCIDNGIRNAISFRFMENIGQLYENTVFAELKRQKKEVYYWKDKSSTRQIDFVIKEGLKIKEAIQVSYSIDNPQILAREFKGMVLGMEEFGLKVGTIITEDCEKEEQIGSKKIIFIPLWKWILNIPSGS